MFKKTLTATVAALTLASASLSTAQPAQAGVGSIIAAAAVGGVVGAVMAKAEAQPAYRPAPQPVARPVSVCPYGTHIGPQGHYCWAN